ncbi:F-box domain-containing protein [Mycena indigotica]|uniref:F-box domain-containing protein n=1 Tax=Mycena indigotica TaxID=2126181 RepID=A0A8H6SWX8_9AGAR|nr:F-box domain-containing protein [Mycena indigotica]KAF7306191.1 F-box domain-containing protein [Mycena indigotica]
MASESYPPSSDHFFSSRLLPTSVECEHIFALLRNRSTLSSGLNEIRSFPAKATPDLLKYEATIAEVQSILTRLRNEQRQLQRYAQACASIFSPIRQLPPELLLPILKDCVSDIPVNAQPHLDIDTDRGAAARFAGPPLAMDSEDRLMLFRAAKQGWVLLSTVCLYWQRLIFGAPHIWANIEIMGLKPQYDLLVAEFVRLTVARAGDELSLDVVAKLHFPAWPPQRHTLQEITATFGALEEARGRLHRLESVEIKFSAYDNHFISQWDVLRSAPVLNRVIFDIGSNLGPPQLPWQQLRDIRVTFTDSTASSNALSFLEQCPASCTITMYGAIKTFHGWPDSGGALHSDISRLVVVNDNPARLHLYSHSKTTLLGKLFGRLVLPNLRTLKFAIADAGLPAAPWDAKGFRKLASHAENLTTLQLCNIAIPPVALLAALHAVPRLGELWVEDVELCGGKNPVVLNDTVFATLRDDMALVPMLRKLSVVSYFQFKAELLAQCLLARAQLVTDVSLDGAVQFSFEACVLVETCDEDAYIARAIELIELVEDVLFAEISPEDERLEIGLYYDVAKWRDVCIVT